MKGLFHYYSVLNVHPSAEIESIKSNYGRLTKKYHPDIYTVNKDEGVDELF
jgi:curved DNA-binding protein CbpA